MELCNNPIDVKQQILLISFTVGKVIIKVLNFKIIFGKLTNY